MRHIRPKSVARDANAWAAKIRRDEAKRTPAVPAPVTIPPAVAHMLPGVR